MTTHAGDRSGRRRLLAVVAVTVGIAAASGPGVAWAAPDPSGGASSEAGSPHTSAVGKQHRRRGSHDTPKAGKSDAGGAGGAGDASAAGGAPTPADATADHQTEPKTAAAQDDSSTGKPTGTTHATTSTATHRPPRAGRTSAGATPDAATKDPTPRKTLGSKAVQTGATDEKATTGTATVKVAAVAKDAAVAKVAAVTTPTPPGPLSPIEKLIALPGRIVNTVLQALDLTVSAGGPKSPLNFGPIDEMLFAAFRGVEEALGLRRTPTVQPVVATETYTGATTAATPTVTQFLDAAAAEYVLGGVPGGLVPFTVNGVQMTSTNLFSGEAAKAWVTPQQQIIIAYQGTTGGTNLLFNPLMAISQIVTDAQIIFTDTTPWAFTDSLTFAQRVQTQAALQGYDADDLFVTGHSLGGWEAEYVAQQTGLGGIGFESPGINTVVPGNGNGSGFVNVETYGDTAAYLATDLPALQPFFPAYVPGGGSKPHYGSLVMIGDPTATNPLVNAAALWGPNLIGDAVFAIDVFGNFFEHHLPGMQAYNLGVSPDPGVVPWLGAPMGPIDAGWGALTISQLQLAASLAGTLIKA